MTAEIADSLRLIEEGAFEEAIALCERLKDDPEQGADALHLLGIAAAHAGEAERALDLLGQAVAADPSNWERRLNLGSLALDLGSVDIAVEELGAVCAEFPQEPVPQSLLGNALSKVGRFEEAVAAQERAVALRPDAAQLWGNLAGAYFMWEKIEAAEAGYAHAVKLDPTDARMHFNLGGARTTLGRLEEGLASFDEALRLRPDYADALTSRGVVLRALGRLDEGIAAMEQAFSAEPDSDHVRFNLGVARLYAGDFAAGYALYEARRERAPQSGREGFGVPWDGSPRPGETLVVEREQGLGDSLQFLRYLRHAKARVGRVVFRCQEVLVPFLKETFREDGIAIEPFQLEPYPGLYAPLVSLPHLLGLTEDPLVGEIELAVDPARIAAWAERLGPKTRGPRIGLVWQGNPGYPSDAIRSVPLCALEPILALPGLEVVSLQQVHGLDQLGALPAHLRPRVLEGQVDAEGAFVDTAAVMKNLDLVVSTDTSAVHLAGTLGVETALLLPHVPDWRWGQGPARWYPSVTAFRQTTRGDWRDPIQRLADHLGQRFGG